MISPNFSLTRCIGLSPRGSHRPVVTIVEIFGRLALLRVLLVSRLAELVLHSSVHECIHECGGGRETGVLPSFLHLEYVSIDRSEFEDTQTDAVKEVEAEAVDAAVAHAELFEDKEALVLLRVDSGVERRLEGIADERLYATCVGKTFIHRGIASHKLCAYKHFWKREELFVATAVNEEFADGRRIDGNRASGAERHLAVADGQAATGLLADDQGKMRFGTTLIAVHTERAADAWKDQPLGPVREPRQSCSGGSRRGISVSPISHLVRRFGQTERRRRRAGRGRTTMATADPLRFPRVMRIHLLGLVLIGGLLLNTCVSGVIALSVIVAAIKVCVEGSSVRCLTTSNRNSESAAPVVGPIIVHRISA